MSAPRHAASAPLLAALSPVVDELVERIADKVAERLAHRAPEEATPTLYSKAELARALGVSVASIDRYVRRGLFAPTVRLGPDGPQRFDLTRVRAALETSAPPAAPHAVVDAAPRLLTRKR